MIHKQYWKFMKTRLGKLNQKSRVISSLIGTYLTSWGASTGKNPLVFVKNGFVFGSDKPSRAGIALKIDIA